MMKNKKINLTILLLVIGCSQFAWGQSLPSHLGKACSNKTLKGEYLYYSTGIDNTGSSFAKAGADIYDGKGTVVGLTTINGSSDYLPSKGTYHIKPNCTGTATYGEGLNFNIFVARNGNSFTFVQTDTGFISSGQVSRVSPTEPSR
jgi:hypothetical protein